MGNNSYLYDLNGNETMNLSHGMAYAHYNNRNLPDSVAFLYGNSLTMRYTADGRRMRIPAYQEIPQKGVSLNEKNKAYMLKRLLQEGIKEAYIGWK